MVELLAELNKGRILLGDGAMGTALQKQGLEAGQCPESWNLNHAEQVQAIIADYVAAGSDIVETNSFGGTRFKLRAFGLEDKTFEINQQAAQIARKAAGTKCLVAGSVGPTGVMMEPLGNTKESEVYAIYLREGGSTDLDLKECNLTFTVQWYNPRTGGELHKGTVARVKGSGRVNLGNAVTEKDKDWAVVAKRELE